MLSSPASPVTPSRTRKRRSLRLSTTDTPSESTLISLYHSGSTNGASYTRRSSQTSHPSFQQYSPVTPRPMSARSSNLPSFHRRQSSRVSVGSNFSFGEAAGNGLGNLADELGGVWDQEESSVQENGFLEGLREGSVDSEAVLQSPESVNGVTRLARIHGSPPSPLFNKTACATLSPPDSTKQRHTGHDRNESEHNDSTCGTDVNSRDVDGIPSSLERYLQDVERLTSKLSWNADDKLGEDGSVMHRTTTALKDLPSESRLETGITRLISANTSLASYRTRAARELFSVAQPLLYSSGVLSNLSEPQVDDLISSLDTLSACLLPEPVELVLPSILTPNTPNPPTAVSRPSSSYSQATSLSAHPSTLHSITHLSTSTTTLLTTLQSLHDTLTSTFPLLTTSARRLHTTSSLLRSDFLTDSALVDESILLIQAGDWDRRCRERMAARTCREQITGFQKTCDLARERWVEKCRKGMVVAA